jgi:hypothetical protein
MKLSIFDRITLGGLLPEKSSYEQAVVVRDLRKKLTLTQDEIVKYSVRTEVVNGNQMMLWNPTNDALDVDFTQLETDVLKNAFKELNNRGEIRTTDEFLDLYLKFS